MRAFMNPTVPGLRFRGRLLRQSSAEHLAASLCDVQRRPSVNVCYPGQAPDQIWTKYPNRRLERSGTGSSPLLWLILVIGSERRSLPCLFERFRVPMHLSRHRNEVITCAASSRAASTRDNLRSQACSLHMASGIFALVTKFQEPVATRRLSSVFTTDRTTGSLATAVRQRSSSIIRAGLSAAQLTLVKTLPRRSSHYRAQDQAQEDGIPECTDPDKRDDRGSVRLAETKPGVGVRGSLGSINPAKVVPAEGPHSAANCNEKGLPL